MLHILRSDASPSSDAVLRAMFAARKRVFVDLLKWDVPVVDGRFEIDQFDDEHATYLILTDGAGAHLASARLLPTTRPHILDSLFPALCDDVPPRGPACSEITSEVLTPRRRMTRRKFKIRAAARISNPLVGANQFVADLSIGFQLMSAFFVETRRPRSAICLQ